jgi:hypothetical protein
LGTISAACGRAVSEDGQLHLHELLAKNARSKFDAGFL